MVRPRRERSVVHKLVIYAATGMLLWPNLRLAAQDIDSIVGSATRTPTTISQDIKDPAEKSAFVNLLKATDPEKILAMARSFLLKYPRSAFLAVAAEAAARSSFDLGNLKSGLDYAHLSLSLLPENPLLLVAVADVQAVLQQNEEAIASARMLSTILIDSTAQPESPNATGPIPRGCRKERPGSSSDERSRVRLCKHLRALIDYRSWSEQRRA